MLSILRPPSATFLSQGPGAGRSIASIQVVVQRQALVVVGVDRDFREVAGGRKELHLDTPARHGRVVAASSRAAGPGQQHGGGEGEAAHRGGGGRGGRQAVTCSRLLSPSLSPVVVGGW